MEGTPAQVAAGQAQWSIVTGDGPSGLLDLGRVDHVITDPPYEQAAHSKGRRVWTGTWADRKQKTGVVVERPLDFASMTSELRKRTGASIAATCARWALVFCQSEGAILWRDALAPMKHVRIGCWTKPDGQPQYSGDRPGVGWEAIEICHAKGRTRWNGGGRLGVWSCPSHGERTRNKDGSQTKAPHQTTKPLALMLDLVRLFTDPGDLIADPFAGSGATVIAALSLGRRCVAWEERAEYADIARERVRAWCAGNTVSSARAGQTTIADLIGCER